jgi:hypothetical protein
MNFWDFVWLLFWSYLIIAYLMILFSILVDVFRDKELNGFLKAVWIIALVVVPFLSALIYVLARGAGMSERQMAVAERSRAQTDGYIRTVAGTGNSPADEIAKAQALLDSGAISRAEFDQLKARVLGNLAGAPAPQPV